MNCFLGPVADHEGRSPGRKKSSDSKRVPGARDQVHRGSFWPGVRIARFLSTAPANSRASLITGVSIETLLDRSSGQSQDALSHDELQRFQIQLFHRLTTEERLNLLNDVDGQ